MLPFSILPLYTCVERLDWRIVEATKDLYASPLRVFRHGILSQMTIGIVSSVILTFVPSLGMYVVSDLLGGSKYMLIGNLIQQQFRGGTTHPHGKGWFKTISVNSRDNFCLGVEEYSTLY